MLYYPTSLLNVKFETTTQDANYENMEFLPERKYM
jgi:hypothetical protein